MDTETIFTPGCSNPEKNFGQIRSLLTESDTTTHAINDLCHELRKLRHEQKKMRREQKKMRHIQEEKVRYAKAEVTRCVKNLLMRQSINRIGAFDCDWSQCCLG